MNIKNIQKLVDLLDRSIKQDAENSLTSGGIICDGYDPKVDEYRNTISHAKSWLAEYQSSLIDQTGISNLKIKYTGAAGYFIEVSKINVSKVPDSFVHKQTLVNASRFITPELKDFEKSLIEAESTLASREYELFQEVRAEVLNEFDAIKSLSLQTAHIDFASAGAHVANVANYTRPKLHKWYDLDIQGWRHPVVENIERDFISNDLSMNKKSYSHVITGPNMGGKSTFLRQNALIVLLAHMWLFVPAREAKIPLTDKIFSRVWASDNLYGWQSTFMVEMQEVANILHNSTDRSFVIIDEVWRWTSTYDGMSLAWAILKQNHDKIKAKTLFATHYHELVDESVKLKWVSNFSVAVWENEDNLVFLRKIIPGGMKKSYWLEVAKLAWIWPEVIAEAKTMMKLLEQEHSQMTLWSLWNISQPSVEIVEKPSKLDSELQDLDINNLTPVGALNLISKWKQK